MADYNTKIVRRSNALQNWAYGPEFTYREVSSFGSGPLAPLMALGMGAGMRAAWLGMGIKPMRAVLDRTLPDPGEGPSEEQRRAGASWSRCTQQRAPAPRLYRGLVLVVIPVTRRRR
jgi:short subunit dehydrogenase-like uncharacterized protein